MLQLQLSKDQKKLVEALKSQQEEVQELQRLLGEQQGALVRQQREILQQQRSMLEQLEEVRRLRLMAQWTEKYTSKVLKIDTLDLWRKHLKRHTYQPLNQDCDQRKRDRLLFFCFQVKSHYNIMMETIKQTSFQNIQGDLGGQVETLSLKDGAGLAQQALTLHKVDMEASVMEVSRRKVARL